MSNKLLTNAGGAVTGTEILGTSHLLNVHQTQVKSIYTYGTLDGATIFVDARAEPNGTWVPAVEIDNTNFGKVLSAQLRAYELRGRTTGGGGSSDITLIVL